MLSEELCDFVLYLVPGMAAALTAGGLWCFSVNQPAIAECWYQCCVALSWEITTTSPYTTGGLLTVGPGIAMLLALVTLHETTLSSLRLYPDYNIAKACQPEYLLGL
jgi:hypothetical protein